MNQWQSIFLWTIIYVSLIFFFLNLWSMATENDSIAPAFALQFTFTSPLFTSTSINMSNFTQKHFSTQKCNTCFYEQSKFHLRPKICLSTRERSQFGRWDRPCMIQLCLIKILSWKFEHTEKLEKITILSIEFCLWNHGNFSQNHRIPYQGNWVYFGLSLKKWVITDH